MLKQKPSRLVAPVTRVPADDVSRKYFISPHEEKYPASVQRTAGRPAITAVVENANCHRPDKQRCPTALHATGYPFPYFQIAAAGMKPVIADVFS